MDELKRGDVLAGRYRVEKVLGEGAMGAVHLCTDQQLFGARWAVKSVGLAGLGAAEAEEATALFLREADMLTRLRHPALPRVVDVFREGDRHFMVMELIIGETLDDRMTRQRAPFGENELLPILRQLASALQYLHSLSPPVIFRDLKPSNVMVTVDGKVQLIDFGIARRHKPGRKADTIILGTPGFCAPEQYGIAQTEPRSDLYALGAMAWHLLSGQDPALVGFTFPPLRQVAPGCTAVTEAILARCLAFNVEDRYPSAAILLADLEFAGSRDAIKRELELLRKPYVARAPVLSPRGYETRRLVGDAQPLAAAAVAQADTPSAPPFEPVRPITHRAGPALDEARFLRSWLARTFEVWWGPGSIHMPRIIALMLLMTVLLPFITISMNRQIAPHEWEQQKPSVLLKACLVNLESMKRDLERYRSVYGRYPARLREAVGEVPECPSAGHDSYSGGYCATSRRFVVYCKGRNHEDAGIPPDHPRLTPRRVQLLSDGRGH